MIKFLTFFVSADKNVIQMQKPEIAPWTPLKVPVKFFQNFFKKQTSDLSTNKGLSGEALQIQK